VGSDAGAAVTGPGAGDSLAGLLLHGAKLDERAGQVGVLGVDPIGGPRHLGDAELVDHAGELVRPIEARADAGSAEVGWAGHRVDGLCRELSVDEEPQDVGSAVHDEGDVVPLLGLNRRGRRVDRNAREVVAVDPATQRPGERPIGQDPQPPPAAVELAQSWGLGLASPAPHHRRPREESNLRPMVWEVLAKPFDGERLCQVLGLSWDYRGTLHPRRLVYFELAVLDGRPRWAASCPPYMGLLAVRTETTSRP